MWCPKCSFKETKVTDSRLIPSGSEIRRRRESLSCLTRFTTYERLEQVFPKVIKKQGYPVEFDENKIRSGVLKDKEKRPVSMTEFEHMMVRIKQQVMQNSEREIRSKDLGEMVIKELKSLDSVAFIRYSSVYFSVEDLEGLQLLITETIKGEL